MSLTTYARARAPKDITNLEIKEFRLFNELVAVRNLHRIFPGNESTTPQLQRLHLLGMAVTAIHNLPGDSRSAAKSIAKIICDRIRLQQGTAPQTNPAMAQRGIAYISTFLLQSTPIDSTHYTLALRIGHDAMNGELDESLINEFSRLWEMREDYI